MLNAAIIGARLAQFVASSILFGMPLFFLYGLGWVNARSLAWPRSLFAGCAGVILVGGIVSFLSQTAAMAGDPDAVFDPETLSAVLWGTVFGTAIIARVATAAFALVACAAWHRGNSLWAVLSLFGAIAITSFAWTGHGAADEGVAGIIHTIADVFHLLAAGVWLGALAALAILLAGVTRKDDAAVLLVYRCLASFSGIGSIVVGVILVTGIVNSWFLVGPARVWIMGRTGYGLLLLIKVGLFAVMLGLAALNRYNLTPRLNREASGAGARDAISLLRISIFLESAAAAAILAIVSVLGTMPPASAQ